MTDLPLVSQPTFHRRWYWWTMIIVILALVIWYVVLVVGVYMLHWQGAKTQAVIRFTPLPIATLNWRPLSVASFLNKRTAIEHYNTYLAGTTSGTYQTGQNSGATTVTQMVRTLESEKLIKKFGITVSTNDVEQAYQAQLLQNGNPDQVASTIKQLYGWSLDEFKQNVIRSVMLRDKLQEKLSFDVKLSGSAKKQADEVLALVKADPKKFGELAKKYSEDAYGASNGDLGFVTQGEQVKEIDDAAFSVGINDISDVIHTKYGYHIIQPLERKTVDGQDQVHLLQITILAPQVDDYITEQLKSSRVMVFDSRLRWNSKTGQAVAK